MSMSNPAGIPSNFDGRNPKWKQNKIHFKTTRVSCTIYKI